MKTRQPYMKAVLVTAAQNARCMSSEMETLRRIYIIDKKTEKTIVDARFYMGRSSSASVVHCSLWVRSPEFDGPDTSGKGKAGGWGYHKQSAALADAIRSAGFELYGSPYGHPVNGDTPAQTRKMMKQRAHIGGCGDGSMSCALLAIAHAMGCTNAVMVG